MSLSILSYRLLTYRPAAPPVLAAPRPLAAAVPGNPFTLGAPVAPPPPPPPAPPPPPRPVPPAAPALPPPNPFNMNPGNRLPTVPYTPPPPPPVTFGADSWRQDLSIYKLTADNANLLNYATPEAAKKLADLLGGTVGITSTVGGAHNLLEAQTVEVKGVTLIAGAAIELMGRQGLPALKAGIEAQATGKSALSPEEAEIAAKNKLWPTKDNVAAFQAEWAGYRTNGSIGPWTPANGTPKGLRDALQWCGVGIIDTQVWNNGIEEAVVSFKMRIGAHQTYRMADGSYAVNGICDPATKAGIIARFKEFPGPGLYLG